MFKLVTTWFWKPGAPIGARTVDALYRGFARLVTACTDYTGRYNTADSTLTINSTDPADADENDARDLGRLDMLLGIMPGLIGIALHEYISLAATATPDPGRVYIELAGVAILYLLAAGSIPRLDDFRVELSGGEPA